jgi:hypothetical protein
VPKRDSDFEFIEVKGTKGLKKANDVVLPMFVINLDRTKNMKLRSDDVFVIGCMKSGTTWVEEIAWLLQNNLDYEGSKYKFHYFERVQFIDEGVSEQELEDMKSPRTIKTHLRSQFLPTDLTQKVKCIYVIRNLKDIVVSQYKFAKSFTQEDGFIGTFDDMVDIYLEGKFWY